MGLLGLVASVVGLLVAGVGGTVGYLYATDARVDATVTDKDCVLDVIAVKTKAFSLDHKVHDVPAQECAVIQVGNFVQYHIRSAHTTVYSSEGGVCLYDSITIQC